MNEQDLFYKCRIIYKQLEDLYWDKTSCGYSETIRKMFKLVNGKVSIIAFTNTLKFDGFINNDDNSYTIGGYISNNDLESTFFRLIEDLTMAYYVTNGGQITYTPEFISKLNIL